ncbi:liprin-alpha-1-like isoform X2 [Bos javanicus]|uniref:liprin-alpha-1-like isoform X2 n=1 Tax=Bos javanicus TaxID=9906 RepID=UPI002AA78F5D|nr:liprin-alpha-1-like isoform X2 [Bos javanicus]
MSKKTCQAPMERDPLSHEEDLAKVIDLQEVIDKQEQSQMEERLAALFAHVTELKEDLDTAKKDLLKSEDVNRKLQQDVHKDQLILNLETLRAELDQMRVRGAPFHYG